MPRAGAAAAAAAGCSSDPVFVTGLGRAAAARLVQKFKTRSTQSFTLDP
jgi:hypothetical protein